MNIPVFISILFAFCTLYSALVLLLATSNKRLIFYILTFWVLFQTVISLSGFYHNSYTLPPRILLLVLPPLISILILFVTSGGRNFLNTLDIKTLQLVHLVRIPVEIGLYALFLNAWVPEVMTFEGNNFDILAGLSAPFVYYSGYRKKVFNSQIILIWNVLSLLLLLNIITIAILSSPYPFNVFGLDPANRAIFYFPINFLPGLIVPIVMLAHLASIKRLSNKTEYQPD